MSHKFEPINSDKLDNPKRRSILPPEETLQKLNLSPGDIMADIGCGTGYFCLPAAQIVGSAGKVYALDISEVMLAKVRERVNKDRLANIEIIKVEEKDFKLINESITYGLACFVIHEADSTVGFLQEFKRILKINGKAVIIEWEKKASDLGPPVTDRLAKQDLMSLMLQVGFSHINLVALTDEFYAVIASKE